MLDRFGRSVTGLRISLTDECNLNCFYCHNEGCASGTRSMTSEEIGSIVGLAAEFGIKKVKLTGGEPLLRGDIVRSVAEISERGVEEISLSTNGTLLAGKAGELANAGLTRVNISLDTLDPLTYERITRKPMLGEVLEGVDAAVDAGLKPIKLNMVLLAGVNDREVGRMIEYASEIGAILQLIELIDCGRGDLNAYRFDLGGIERELRRRAVEVQTRYSMQARKKYLLPEGEVEVVKPTHNSEFCANCTRLRLTPDGYLKPCLMRNHDLVDILSPVRRGDFDGARRAFVQAIVSREPYFSGNQ